MILLLLLLLLLLFFLPTFRCFHFSICIASTCWFIVTITLCYFSTNKSIGIRCFLFSKTNRGGGNIKDVFLSAAMHS